MPSRSTTSKSKSPRRRQNPKESALKGLSRYRAKRDFSYSPEPTGGAPRPAGKSKTPTLAYCIQKHLATALHYDFRLEWKGVLLSWAVPKGPSVNPRDKRLAMRVEDHPYDYREFEGVIPSGYGAGVVMLWDEGTWEPEAGFENVAASVRGGELKFSLHGVKLKGSWVLVRTGEGTPTGEREKWLLIKHRDEWAGELDIAEAAPRGVHSDRTFEEILRKDPDIWESHKAGCSDLAKIAAKVAALNDRSGQRRGRAKK